MKSQPIQNSGIPTQESKANVIDGTSNTIAVHSSPIKIEKPFANDVFENNEANSNGLFQNCCAGSHYGIKQTQGEATRVQAQDAGDNFSFEIAGQTAGYLKSTPKPTPSTQALDGASKDACKMTFMDPKSQDAHNTMAPSGEKEKLVED